MEAVARVEVVARVQVVRVWTVLAVVVQVVVEQAVVVMVAMAVAMAVAQQARLWCRLHRCGRIHAQILHIVPSSVCTCMSDRATARALQGTWTPTGQHKAKTARGRPRHAWCES